MIVLDKTPRPEQIELLEFTKKSIKENNKFVLLQAPTGCLTKNEKINIYIIKEKFSNVNKKNFENTLSIKFDFTINYINELTRTTIINDLSNYYDITMFNDFSDIELNIFFTKHISKHSQDIKMKDFYELSEKNILINSLDGYVKVGEKIKKEQLECFTLTLVDKRKLSGAFNHLVETERGWVMLKDLTSKDFVLTIDGFIKVKNIRKIKTQDVYDLECLHKNHRYLSNGISNHNTGKSYFIVMFMDWFKKQMDIGAHFDILTNSKILQEQYTNDYPFMNSLWGKGSYVCERYETNCALGSEICRLGKKNSDGNMCDNCPYNEALLNFSTGTVGLTNYHLFLTYKIYAHNRYPRQSKVLIIDEAHGFEEVFADFISLKLNRNILKSNGFNNYEIKTVLSYFGKKPENLSKDEFMKIVRDKFLPYAIKVKGRISNSMDDSDIKTVKILLSLTNNIVKWKQLLKEYKENPENWIHEVDEITDMKKRESYYEFKAQPVWSDKYLEEYVWKGYDYVLMLSGTLLDKDLIIKINGLDKDKTAYKELQSPFNVKNRPIYYFKNLGKQTYANKKITWENQKKVLSKILNKHKNDKGIIHTANYEIQSWINNEFDNNRLLCHDSENRSETLQNHYSLKVPTVLVSPSMTTGVDLKDDMSRHQTILKMPYPFLGSKKVKRRMETNKDWYGWKTCVELMQMYGRSVRTKDDNATTYILDASFDNILKYNSRFLPLWFRNAIIKIQ